MELIETRIADLRAAIETHAARFQELETVLPTLPPYAAEVVARELMTLTRQLDSLTGEVRGLEWARANTERETDE